MQRAYSVLHVKALDAEKRILTGVATTPTPDRMGDVVEPRGVEFQNPLSLLLYHDNTRPVGTVKFERPTDDGIKFSAHIPEITEPGTLRDRVEEAWQSVRAGLIRGVSIGFRVLDDGIELLRSGGIRFTKTEVVELSLVSVPANAEAVIETIKSLDAPHLAASGRSGVSALRSGVTDTAVRSAKKDAGTAMKRSTSDQIQTYTSERDAKQAKMAELMTAAADSGATLDETQSEEYEGLQSEVKALDKHISRLVDFEAMQKKSAKAVTGGSIDEAARSRGGSTVVQIRQPELPPGIGFARAVKAAVVARLDGRNMLQVAKEMYPSDERLHGHITHVLNLPNIVAHLKAAVPAGTTTQSDWASALVDPTNLAGEFIEYLRPATILGKFGANGIPELRRVPFNVRMIEQTQGGTGYWVGQGAPKPLTAFGFAPHTLAFTKVAAISVITEELARFSTPSAEQLTRDGLRDTLVERIDRDLIDPAEAGVANVQPASLTYGVSPLAPSGTTADAARADIANLVAEFVQSNLDPAGLVIVMPTALALYLSFQVNALGQPEFPNLSMTGGSIKNIPVITSQYAANASGGGNLVIAINAREVFLADDGQVTIDASREASLQMLDNPTNNSATATPTTMVSMWQTNSIALRAERFINWSKRRTGAVAYMDDVNWGGVGSPVG